MREYKDEYKTNNWWNRWLSKVEAILIILSVHEALIPYMVYMENLAMHGVHG